MPSTPTAMASSEIRGPDLVGVVVVAVASGLEHVVIGGFALERVNGELRDPIPGLDP